MHPNVSKCTLSQPLTPFLDGLGISAMGAGNVELEVLNLIAKLPGVILYLESKTKLIRLRDAHPDVFGNRRVYATVHRMFEFYTFKLSARRDVVALFTPEVS